MKNEKWAAAATLTRFGVQVAAVAHFSFFTYLLATKLTSSSNSS